MAESVHRSQELLAREAGRTAVARFKPAVTGSGKAAARDGRTVQVHLGSRGSHRVTPAEARLLAAELVAAAAEAEGGAQ